MRTPVREAFYTSLNHNEYAVSPAVSRMKMPPVRDYASSLLPRIGGLGQSIVSGPFSKPQMPN